MIVGTSYNSFEIAEEKSLLLQNEMRILSVDKVKPFSSLFY